MKLIVIFIFTISSLLANAETHSAMGNHFYFGVGSTFYNMGKHTNSETGKATLLGDVYLPHLMLTGKLPLFANVKLNLHGSYTPVAARGGDYTKKTIMNFGAASEFDFGLFDVKGGLGLLMYSIKGDGGSHILNNGAGLATFYSPSTAVVTKNLHVDAGFGLEVASFRLDADVLVLGILSQRRSFTGMVTLSKGFL